MQPIEVVELLNNLFSRFDKLVERYGLNKVKTIGDCYMVTSIPGGGDPAPLCAAVCSFGLDMIQALHEYNIDAQHSKSKTLGLRVGVHSGPVVAGVVGTKRFLYDIWGDAVRLV
jgi:adenylate cyclase